MKVIFVNIFKMILLTCITSFLMVSLGFASPVIPYSGYLTSKNKPISGELKMKFELCPTKTSTSNTCWSSAKSTSPQEQWTEISIFNGYFQVNLGDSTRMNTLRSSDLVSSKLYLKIHIKNSKVEISLPIRQLQTVAPAVDAAQALSFEEEESLTRAHHKPRIKSPYSSAELKKLFTINKKTLLKNIQTFQTSSDPEERFLAATSILFDSQLLDKPQNKNITLTSQQKTILQQATVYSENIQKLKKNFENSLTNADIRFITQDNPDTIWKNATRFSWDFANSCSKEEYQKLRKKLSLGELHKRGHLVVQLNTISESEFRPKYYKRIQELISSKPQFKQYKILTQTILNMPLVEKTEKDLSKRIGAQSNDPARAKRATKSLIETGLSEEQVKPYVVRLGRLSPGCLGQINLAFIKLMRKDITLTRGECLLKELEKNKNTDIYELSINPKDPICNSRSDGWHGNYEIKSDPRFLVLLSLGADRERGTPDDIIIGRVPHIKSPKITLVHFDIDRTTITQKFSDENQLTRQARLIPHYRQGKHDGFKIIGIRPNSLFKSLRFLSGDILKSMNEQKLNSVDKLLDLFKMMKTKDQLSFVFEREGRLITYKVSVRTVK